MERLLTLSVPGDTLIFKMEIIKINGGKVPALKCDVTTKAECNEKEVAYIEKSSALDGPAAKKELDRLQLLTKKPMNPELTNWCVIIRDCICSILQYAFIQALPQTSVHGFTFT